MNIQQLNQSGQRLSVFLTTAGIALAVTGISWFCVEQINDYHTWKQRDPSVIPKSTPRFSITVRIIMIVWLVKHGHTKWMQENGAWLPLLTNSPKKGLSTDVDACITAGDYVSRYCHKKYKDHSMEDDLFCWSVDE